MILEYGMLFFFFFQAEDGIRDHCVTGVQTCALPISLSVCARHVCSVIKVSVMLLSDAFLFDPDYDDQGDRKSVV